MKKVFLAGIFCLLSGFLLSQTYDISFAVQNESYIPDSVKASNVEQGTSITLNGNDILRLSGTTSVSTESSSSDLHIFPNPMTETALVNFYNPGFQNVKIEVLDITGRVIIHKNADIEPGNNSFALQGLGKGTFLLSISNEEDWIISKRIISTSGSNNLPTVTLKSSHADSDEFHLKNLSEAQSIIEMNYNSGETIQLLAYYNGEASSQVEFVPGSSQTVEFYFVSSDLPATPTGLTATNNPGMGCVQLMWNQIPGISTYNIYWSDTENGSYINFASSENYFFDDCDAAVGENYYKVKAVNQYGESQFSNSAFALVSMDPVTGLTATHENNGNGVDYFVLSWDEFPGAYTYQVWVLAPGWEEFVHVYTVSDTTCQYAWDIQNYSYYYFAVIAYVNDNNISDYSEVVTGYIPGPGYVTGLIGAYNTSNASVDLSWDPFPGTDYYEIWRQGPSDSDISYLGYSETTSFSDYWYAAEGIYNYQVIAVDGTGYISELSPVSSVYVPSQDLQPVTNLSANFSGGNVNLSWNAFSGAAVYEIWRKGPGDIDFEYFDGSYSNSYVDEYTTETGYYHYKVIAADGTYIISEFSNIATAAVTY